MKIPASVAKFAGKANRWFVKNGPTLMAVGGGLMTVGGAVMACKATLQADEVLEEHKTKMARIQAAHDLSIELDSEDNCYTAEDERRDKIVTYAETAVRFVKLYGPSVSMLMGGVSLLEGAFYISERRGARTLAALNALNEAYNGLLAQNPEEGKKQAALPMKETEEKVKVKEVSKPEGDEETENEAAELIYEGYIPVEQFDILDSDPFTITFDGNNTDWSNGNSFILNSSQIEATFRAFELRRTSGHDIWVNDVRRAFNVEEKSLGWAHGWTHEVGDCIEYEMYPCVYDIIDDMVVGMNVVPGNNNEERFEVLRNIEFTESEDKYCIVIKLHGATPNETPRFIRNEVYAK